MRSDNISGIIIFIFAKAEKSADFPAFLFSQEGAVTGDNKKAIVFAFLHQRWLRIGAADEARTRYLHLGKVALYQMSYGRILETLLGLLTGASDRNRTNDTGIFSPLLYRLSYRGISGAIIPAPSRAILANFGAPAKACEARFCGEEEKVWRSSRQSCLQDRPMNCRTFDEATRIGLEPTTPSVTGWCSNQLSYRAIWWKLTGSNR